MLFRLSLKNIRKSIKDYSIYFFTLALGVCIFYVFNAIGDQTAMMELSWNKIPHCTHHEYRALWNECGCFPYSGLSDRLCQPFPYTQEKEGTGNLSYAGYEKNCGDPVFCLQRHS